MKRRRTMKTLAGACALALAGTWFATGVAAQTVLKFSHTDQPGGLRQKAAELFAQKVEQYTQGRYKVQVFPAAQLANDPKAVEQLQLGGIDFTVTGTGTYATHIPTLNLMLMPYLVENYEQGWKLYDDSKWLKAQFAKGPEKGFRYLSAFEAGFRSMTTKDALGSPADAKGKKLRTYPERDAALAAGGDGLLRADHAAARGVSRDPAGHRLRPGKPDRYDPRQQVLRSRPVRHADQARLQPDPAHRVGEDVAEADAGRPRRDRASGEGGGRLEPQRSARGRDRLLADMQSKGAKIGRPNLAPFREAVQPAYAKAKEKYGADVDTVLTEADAVRKANPGK